MSDAEPPPTLWASFLREIIERPGWDVAKLAKEAEIHRSTIFRWLAGDKTARVTVEYVVRIARTARVSESRALHAAAGLVDDEDEESIRLIMTSDVPDEVKEELVHEIRRMQRQAADDRVTLAQRLLDMAKRVRGAN